VPEDKSPWNDAYSYGWLGLGHKVFDTGASLKVHTHRTHSSARITTYCPNPYMDVYGYAPLPESTWWPTAHISSQPDQVELLEINKDETNKPWGGNNI